MLICFNQEKFGSVNKEPWKPKDCVYWHIYMPQIPVAMGMGKRRLIPKNLAYVNFSRMQSSEFQPSWSTQPWQRLLSFSVSCRLFFQVYLHCHFSKTLDPAIWVQFTLYHLHRPDSLKKDMDIYFLTWNTPQSSWDTKTVCEDQRLESLCNAFW